MKQINNFLFLLWITSIFSGCVGWIDSKPENNVDFAMIEQLSDLDGTYQSQGEVESGEAFSSLSWLIWPDKELDHKAILNIEVKAINDTTIQVKGMGAEGVVKESILVQGKDFKLKSGRIQIRRGAQVSGFKRGEAFIGPVYENIELGLDQRGDGKYKSGNFAAGLVFSVVPFAFGGSEEIRFKRVK